MREREKVREIERVTDDDRLTDRQTDREGERERERERAHATHSDTQVCRTAACRYVRVGGARE